MYLIIPADRGEDMDYKFYCIKCEKDVIVDIPMNKYNEEKDKQKCECGTPLRRVYEWNGIATGSGDGWCGKSSGNMI